MTPRFPRRQKFANPYAIVAVDFVFTILWLSAFAAVASWNSTKKCKGGCHLSRVVVGLGVFIWFVLLPQPAYFPKTDDGNWMNRLLWCLTTAMSVYGCIYYRRE